jgi:hypothetical protein
LDLLVLIAQRSSSASGDIWPLRRSAGPFITHFDASTIKNERQLTTMVKERCSRSQEEAEADVHEWMEGKAF